MFLKLNCDILELERYIKPTLEQYDSIEHFETAKSLYEAREKLVNYSNGRFSENDIQPIDLKFECKKEKYLYDTTTYKTEIKKGSILTLTRYDGNGSFNIKVIKLKLNDNRCIVYTNCGWFVFSKFNCKDSYIQFNWKKNHKDYLESYDRIDGNSLYINQKIEE